VIRSSPRKTDRDASQCGAVSAACKASIYLMNLPRWKFGQQLPRQNDGVPMEATRDVSVGSSAKFHEDRWAKL